MLKSQELLHDAAIKVLYYVQQELRARAPVLDVPAAFELAYARAWALRALIDLHGQKHTKALEMRIADRIAAGRPLAICGVPVAIPGPPDWLSLGFRGSKAIETPSGRVQIPNSGCFHVFPDSVRQDRAKMWAYWCPTCKPRVSKRTRRQGARYAKRVDALLRVSLNI